MRLTNLWLTDFRSYEQVHLEGPAGCCVLTGPNAVGKTNLLEAIAWLATLSSFRSAPSDALIRTGAETAVLRAEVDHDERTHLIEAEINRTRSNRVMVDRQRLRRTRDLRDILRVSVFTPDDLRLVKGSPGVRREFIDDLVVSLHPRNAAVRADWEKALRQRNALLKQVGGRLDASAAATLDVWDDKAGATGGELVRLRRAAVEMLTPAVDTAYRDIAAGGENVTLVYAQAWGDDLKRAFSDARRDDLRRGVSTVGPHRDELSVSLDGRPSRTHCSQGEQRCLALALRLAAHRLVASEFGHPPVLLLDDIFSELDDARARALVGALPEGQSFLTTAGALPDVIDPAQTVRVYPGTLAITDGAGEPRSRAGTGAGPAPDEVVDRET